MGIFDSIRNLVTKGSLNSRNDGLTLSRLAAGSFAARSGVPEVYPTYRYGDQALAELAKSSDVLRITHNALIREIFRAGFDVTDQDDAVDSTIPKNHILLLRKANN